jgi:DNA-binding NarL/FixJ family response regulator
MSERSPEASASRKVRALLADDSARFLEAARRFLTTQPIEIVGEARMGREALDLVEALAPDLVLLDLEMPDLDGLTVLRSLRSRPGSPRIIVVTLHDQDEYRDAAAEAGADGFVAKRELTTALVPLIHQMFEPLEGARGAGGGDRA